MKTIDDRDPVKIFDGDLWQTGILKSLLDNAEIESFVKDEYMGTLKPWIAAGGGAGAIKIFVAKADVERALQVVAEYEKNAQSTAEESIED